MPLRARNAPKPPRLARLRACRRSARRRLPRPADSAAARPIRARAASGGCSSRMARCCPFDGALTETTSASCSNAGVTPATAPRLAGVGRHGGPDRPRDQGSAQRRRQLPPSPACPCDESRRQLAAAAITTDDQRGAGGNTYAQMTAPPAAPTASQVLRGIAVRLALGLRSRAHGSSRAWRGREHLDRPARRPSRTAPVRGRR